MGILPLSYAPAVSDARPAELPMLTRAYLFLLLLALPIDYFSPTGALFREGGARPAIPLMVLGSLWIIYRQWRWMLVSLPALWRRCALLLATIGLLGGIAFGINVAWEISYWDGARSPMGQFLSQASLFVLVMPVLVAHAWLFSQPGLGKAAVRLLPWAVAIHLLMIAGQAAHIFEERTFPLSYFRGYVQRDTPNGLMTEPSYVGVMAGMYGLALLVCMPEKRWRYRALGFAPMLIALLIGGKTLIPVLLTAWLGYAYQSRTRILSLRNLAVVALVAGVGYQVVVSRAALDVRDNLSSAMRFGSTLLAYNVARAGYGVLGIGFGQFHFVYRPKYAPWFLNYSTEAIAAFARSANVRASTYNLPIRIVDETGILGLLLYCLVLFLLFRNARRHNDLIHRLGAVIAAASLGFLLTQDAYFFPPLVCGASMMAAIPANTPVWKV